MFAYPWNGKWKQDQTFIHKFICSNCFILDRVAVDPGKTGCKAGTHCGCDTSALSNVIYVYFSWVYIDRFCVRAWGFQALSGFWVVQNIYVNPSGLICQLAHLPFYWREKLVCLSDNLDVKSLCSYVKCVAGLVISYNLELASVDVMEEYYRLNRYVTQAYTRWSQYTYQIGTR